MRKTYLITHCVWMVLALAVIAESNSLGFGSFMRPGPGFVPLLAAACLAVFAALGLFHAAAGKQSSDGGVAFRGSDSLKIGMVTAVLLVYVFLWDIIGFLPSSFLMLLFLFKCAESLRWQKAVIASSLTLAFTYFLFSMLLGARLPAGRLWTYFIN